MNHPLFVVALAAEAELGAIFLNCKEGIFFDSPWKNWAIPNRKHQPIAIMPPLLALQITPSNGSNHDRWR
jgi:hypothetical protein